MRDVRNAIKQMQLLPNVNDRFDIQAYRTEIPPFYPILSYQIGFEASCGQRIVDPNLFNIVCVSPSNRHGTMETEAEIAWQYMQTHDN